MRSRQSPIKGGRPYAVVKKRSAISNERTVCDSEPYGLAAYKLWNVGNYEKKNYKELGMEKFPNWYDQKKRLKDNFFYKNLPSQTAQDVLSQLHGLPYEQIYKKQIYKLSVNGIRLIKQKESYLSQCSPNSLKVSRKYSCKKNRQCRGLYVEGSVIYNADSIGVNNILRLYLQNEQAPIPNHHGLSAPVQVSV